MKILDFWSQTSQAQVHFRTSLSSTTTWADDPNLSQLSQLQNGIIPITPPPHRTTAKIKWHNLWSLPYSKFYFKRHLLAEEILATLGTWVIALENHTVRATSLLTQTQLQKCPSYRLQHLGNEVPIFKLEYTHPQGYTRYASKRISFIINLICLDNWIINKISSAIKFITSGQGSENYSPWAKSGSLPIKFYGNTTMLSCLLVVCGCFHTTMKELSE